MGGGPGRWGLPRPAGRHFSVLTTTHHPHCPPQFHHSPPPSLPLLSTLRTPPYHSLVLRCLCSFSVSRRSLSLSLSLFLPPSMSDQFSQLARYTVIVADTGDVQAIQKYKPTDATTNPSLLYAAVQDPSCDHLVDEAIQWAQTQPGPQLQNILDRLSVNVGTEITRIVPGLVSTELDSRLSFDKEASIAKARAIIASYKEKGVDKERILIKMASTWEGLQAAEVLEKEGIHVNMTLLFSKAQAVVAANVKATLVSPFVGRILDWSVANTDKKTYTAEEDPGVQSVTEIYNYFKSIGSATVVMGASFRNKGEILALAGCDKLTIAPKLLEELKQSTEPVERKLVADEATKGSVKEHVMSEKEFRWEMNENQMATEKLSDGIRKFAADTVKLEAIINKKLKGQLNH